MQIVGGFEHNMSNLLGFSLRTAKIYYCDWDYMFACINCLKEAELCPAEYRELSSDSQNRSLKSHVCSLNQSFN